MNESKEVEFLSQKLKNEIVDKLEGKIPELHCPMCGHNRFVLIDGLVKHTLQRENSYELAGRSLPCVLTVCKNCGFLSEHVIVILGLMEDVVNSSKEDES